MSKQEIINLYQEILFDQILTEAQIGKALEIEKSLDYLYKYQDF